MTALAASSPNTGPKRSRGPVPCILVSRGTDGRPGADRGGSIRFQRRPGYMDGMTADRPAPSNPARRLAAEPRVARLVRLARERLGATEVWVFGSRARGAARPDSDWDIFVVLPDDAPDSALDPVAAWRLGRDAGLAAADVFAARAADVREDAATPNTLAYVLAREGRRVDV